MRTIFLTIGLLSSEIHLTKRQVNYIAKKVWQNEGAGKDIYLVCWNKGGFRFGGHRPFHLVPQREYGTVS